VKRTIFSEGNHVINAATNGISLSSGGLNFASED
jgi:hypothetical protein